MKTMKKIALILILALVSIALTSDAETGVSSAIIGCPIILMAIIATNKGGNYEPVPEGMHVARCVAMYHVGTVPEKFDGTEKIMNKVILTWELPNCLHVFDEEKGEEIRLISKEYTLSMNEKANLRKDLDSWRGTAFTEEEAAEFDVTKLLGIECMIQVVHKVAKASGNTNAKVNVITPVADGVTVPEQTNESFEFNYENIAETYPTVHEWIAKKIRTSEEFAASGYVPETEAPAEAATTATPAATTTPAAKPAAKKAAPKKAAAAKPKF